MSLALRQADGRSATLRTDTLKRRDILWHFKELPHLQLMLRKRHSKTSSTALQKIQVECLTNLPDL